MRRRLEVRIGIALAVLSVLIVGFASAPYAAGGAAGDPNVHLGQILDRSIAPEFRRFGSPGMAAAADYAAIVLEGAGYDVLRHDVPSSVYAVDYAEGHRPALVRVADAKEFRAESAFSIGASTPLEGITCTVRAVEDVASGDCGFVPFEQVSPEWNNVLADVAGAVTRIRERGGVGAVLQGDLERDALLALRVRQPIPVVVALASAGDVVGHAVRVRVLGAHVPATLHNVVAVRPPSEPSRGYVLLQGHLDGWFEAAADNAAGSAAVLASAERLAGDHDGRGLLVALYDGEEWGMLGSRALSEDLAEPGGVTVGVCGPTVHLHDIVAVVNLDAPSAIASDVLGRVRDVSGVLVPLVSYRVLVTSEEPTLTALHNATMTAAGVLGLPVPVAVANPLNGGMGRTDGRWFHEAGIPVAWPVAGYPEYHTDVDGLETVDPVDLANVTTGAVSLVRAIDDAPVGRVGGSLAAPGSSTSPADPACAAGSAAVAVAPSAPTEPARGSIPATGRQVALLPAALALLLALVLLVPGRQTT